ncbi:MAG TPA: RNA polymerase sigma factor [Kofleriaceae bacterium]|nr:RNA polymerase sigma factor [Kofleriaceae bacterium]
MADQPLPETAASLPGVDRLPDDEVVRRVVGGEHRLYALLLPRYNQRLFRVVRAILRRDDEAEDAVQQAWVAAFENLAQFRGESSFVTWLTRIAVNEALGRLRARKRRGDLALVDMQRDQDMATEHPSPEEDVAAREMGMLLEAKIDALPELYRVVFVMREVEELGTADTASCLGLSEEAVRVRLHRARHMLQESLTETLGTAVGNTFRFGGARCARIASAVLDRLGIAER